MRTGWWNPTNNDNYSDAESMKLTNIEDDPKYSPAALYYDWSRLPKIAFADQKRLLV